MKAKQNLLLYTIGLVAEEKALFNETLQKNIRLAGPRCKQSISIVDEVYGFA